MFRNVSMKCLTEIAGVTVPHYDDKFIAMFNESMQQLETMLPVDTNIKDAYKKGSDAEQMFIQNLAMFFCAFLKSLTFAGLIGLKNSLMDFCGDEMNSLL